MGNKTHNSKVKVTPISPINRRFERNCLVFSQIARARSRPRKRGRRRERENGRMGEWENARKPRDINPKTMAMRKPLREDFPCQILWACPLARTAMEKRNSGAKYLGKILTSKTGRP
ncbi:MAG: hypothetical protein L0Y56_08385, partial [Nitrospira sp.]|nr:hypothetical protein [Nitrospira sp.]